jgi:glycosyltransferase involved in cell wall biosynthesis
MEIVKKTKILFLVTQSEMGGTQRYIYETVRLLDKNLYEVLVAAGQGDGELFGKLKSIGITSFPLKQMKRTPWPWQISKSVWEIRDLIKKERPDILFLCSTTAGILGSLAGCLTSEVKHQTIYRIGGWAFRDPRAFWKNWLILLAEKLTAPLKDVVVVNSEVDRLLALKYYIVPEKKLFKIYNGIDADSLTFLSREEARKRLLTSDSNEPLIGCVANFYKTKGLEYLIEAARIMAEVPPPIFKPLKFIIIGEGRLRPKLEGLIKRYGLEDKIILAGRISNAYQYLKAFDVFVLPSLKEGFPWIILEALAAKVPIIASQVGALPEIIGEEFLVTPGNADELAKKIGRLVEQPKIPTLKSEFTSQKMLQETEKLLR